MLAPKLSTLSAWGLRRRGSARYENGGVFEGEFKAEQRWGWGRHTFPNGDVYEGEWLHDKIQGPRMLMLMLLDMAV